MGFICSGPAKAQEQFEPLNFSKILLSSKSAGLLNANRLSLHSVSFPCDPKCPQAADTALAQILVSFNSEIFFKATARDHIVDGFFFHAASLFCVAYCF